MQLKQTHVTISFISYLFYWLTMFVHFQVHQTCDFQSNKFTSFKSLVKKGQFNINKKSFLQIINAIIQRHLKGVLLKAQVEGNSVKLEKSGIIVGLQLRGATDEHTFLAWLPDTPAYIIRDLLKLVSIRLNCAHVAKLVGPIFIILIASAAVSHAHDFYSV